MINVNIKMGKKHNQCFGGTGDHYDQDVYFTFDNGKVVKKTIRCGGVAELVNEKGYKAYSIAKAYRESIIDFLYGIHGDAWRRKEYIFFKLFRPINTVSV